MRKVFLLKDYKCVLKDNNTIQLRGLDFLHSTESEGDMQFCKNLSDIFRREHGSSVGICELLLELSSTSGHTNVHMRLQLTDSTGTLKTLKNKILLEYDLQVGVVVQFENWYDLTITTKEMNIENETECLVQDSKIVGNYKTNESLRKRENVTMTITIHITTSCDYLSPLVDLPGLKAFKRLLDEELECDAVVVAGNGDPVKCHKSFLMAHSSVFSAMFQTDMEEGSTGSLKLPDMSEAGVRALLAYLYYFDQTEPNANSVVAFELLTAGHKYDIPALESTISQILISKPVQWFDVNLATKIYLFAPNLPFAYQLKKKAVQIMKENIQELQQFSAYQELFKQKPDLAKEMFLYVLGEMSS